MNDKRRDIKSEIESIAPNLESYLDDSDLLVPVGYFDQLEEEVLSKVQPASSPNHWYKWVIGIAAMIAISLVGFRYLLHEEPIHYSFEAQLADMNDEELLAILEDDLDVSGEELIELGFAEDMRVEIETQIVDEVAEVDRQYDDSLIESEWIFDDDLDALTDEEWYELLNSNLGI